VLDVYGAGPLTDADPIAGVLPIDKPEGPTSMAVCARVRAALVGRAGRPSASRSGTAARSTPSRPGSSSCSWDRDQALRRGHGGREGYTAEHRPAAHLPHRRPGERTRAGGGRGRAGARATDRGGAAVVHGQDHAGAARALGDEGGRQAGLRARAGRQDRPPRAPPRRSSTSCGRAYAWPSLVLDVRCGKGTYIRSLARDIGRALGVGGMLVGPAPHRGSGGSTSTMRCRWTTSRERSRGLTCVIPEVERSWSVGGRRSAGPRELRRLRLAEPDR
jgi:tRNA pseudouridine55 synthase